MSDWRSGAYLALVYSGIFPLGIPDPQRPLVRMGRVLRFEALVGRVCVTTHCQQVDISMPHPRNLKATAYINDFHNAIPLSLIWWLNNNNIITIISVVSCEGVHACLRPDNSVRHLSYNV